MCVCVFFIFTILWICDCWYLYETIPTNSGFFVVLPFI